ncbi:hypothetical protein VNO78_08228 [Psophocarpus tetragonolobus]|uniref:Uncharacterized protein n=1 Tax=Psophocarpus tetragonolobus TaxID=3891 RepID=A0AAN9XT66_PSOTE
MLLNGLCFESDESWKVDGALRALEHIDIWIPPWSNSLNDLAFQIMYEQIDLFAMQHFGSFTNLAEMNELSKARAILTMAHKKNPQNIDIWLAAFRAELKHGYSKEA